MKAINVGDAAPEFTATVQNGQQISLADFRGKQAVVLFFYPKDNSPICTQEACSFRDSYEDFTRAGAVVIGVSSDTAASHQAFADSQRLPFLLVADVDGDLRKAFAVPKSLGVLPGRVTFVIDRQGIIRHVFNSQWFGQKHVEEALKTVRQLQEPSETN
ncbi:MAG: peroxiredoxin [Planctomycetaceae bacterium]|nr:MAG: peroxiredoxin [Planctomycetaceae bacterium]